MGFERRQNLAAAGEASSVSAWSGLYFFAYTFLAYLLTPVQFLRLWLKGRKLPAYRERWSERMGHPVLTDDRPRIWLHSVSVGEAVAAEPIVNRLLAEYPDHSVLVTTTTPTGSDQVRRMFGDRVEHSYFPYDLPHVVRRFLRKAKPSLLVLMETEIWPNCLRQCEAQKIPVVLANARLSEKSYQGYGSFRGLLAPLLSTIRLIAAQTIEDRERFVSLGSRDSDVVVLGNVKSDVSVPVSVRYNGEALRERLGSHRSVWIAASTHRGEEQEILRAHRQVLDVFDDALLVLVPRHPDRFDEVAQLCVESGFTYARRSRNELPGSETDVYLGDTMGELLHLYAASDLAFVGGSLSKTGGHNPLEPASLGKPVITGPNVKNFQSMYEQLNNNGACETVYTGYDLGNQVIRYLSDDELREESGQAAQGLVEESKGASENLMGLIARIVRGY